MSTPQVGDMIIAPWAEEFKVMAGHAPGRLRLGSDGDVTIFGDWSNLQAAGFKLKEPPRCEAYTVRLVDPSKPLTRFTCVQSPHHGGDHHGIVGATHVFWSDSHIPREAQRVIDAAREVKEHAQGDHGADDCKQPHHYSELGRALNAWEGKDQDKESVR